MVNTSFNLPSLAESSFKGAPLFSDSGVGKLEKTSPVDAVLLTGVLAGDQIAMADIFERYSPAVYSVALRVLKDPSHAEDVTQEVFLQVWRHPSSFEQRRGSLVVWLVVVARNRAIDILRRRRPSLPADDAVLVSSVDVASEAERNILTGKIRKALKNLPLEQQTSVELAFLEGLTHAEIARRTGDPLGTVKSRIRLALTSLRKAIAA